MTRPNFSERLKATSTKPGVYLMRDVSNNVLYVGKASNLRHRLRSYFVNQLRLTPKIQTMVSKVVDFDYILTESDQEAVILECTLIKRHKPKYNARLKDGKSYPFIKIDTRENFPQVYITRQVANDGARYFGPFASAGSVRQTLKLLKKLFPYRSCTKLITGKDPRPCLDFFINRCVGPCIGIVNQQQYREIINQVILFMEGKTDCVVRSIGTRMKKAAEKLEFERAAVLRDQIKAIERVHEKQKVLNLTLENLDVIATAQTERETLVEVFFIRHGKLIGRDNFMMAGTQDDTPPQVLTAFIKQFYAVNPYVPPHILIQHPLEEKIAIQQWLQGKRQSQVSLFVPQRGEKRHLVQMVSDNAHEGLKQLRAKQQQITIDGLNTGMADLQEALSLPRLPQRVECYDISNIHGTNSVGSLVVFVDGKPKSSDYRRFKIKTVDRVDDYASIREILTRRFRRMSKATVHGLNDLEGDPDSINDRTWEKVPDLVLIDGGKGHLGTALQVFLELGIDSIPLASIAKENEEIFVPQVLEPIVLPRNSQALFLVQNVRDEAHRFAITYHRQLRSKQSIKSAVDLVPGIGPKRRNMLLSRFGSVKEISVAPLHDIASVPGITMTLARRIKEHL